MLQILFPVMAYFVGSISSAIIISRLKGLDDPRKTGSGNPGATNVLRSGDKSAAALTLLGDIAKGMLPVLLAKWFGASDAIIALSGLGAFLGHLFPAYYQFKGGKGVATGFGVFIAISPLLAFLMALIWVATAFISHYSSLAGLVAVVASPILMIIIKPNFSYILLAGILAALLIWRHAENIKRLLDGTEGKIKL